MKDNIILAIAISVLAFLYYKQWQDNKQLKAEQEITNANLEALKDTVALERNKAGDLEFTKQSLISRNGDLERWNKDLAAEVKKEKGQVIFLQKTLSEINNADHSPDTIYNTVTVDKFDSNKYSILTKYDTLFNVDNYRHLEVETNISLGLSGIRSSYSKITKDIMGFNLITGLKEEQGKLRIFIRSDYPGLTFSKIDGSLIDPQKSQVLKSMFPPKKWGIGPVFGLGITPGMKFGAYFGIGIQYQLIRF